MALTYVVWGSVHLVCARTTVFLERGIYTGGGGSGTAEFVCTQLMIVDEGHCQHNFAGNYLDRGWLHVFFGEI